MKEQNFNLEVGTVVYITSLERDDETTASRGEVVESNDRFIIVDYAGQVCAPTGAMVQIGFHCNRRFVTAPARVGELVQCEPCCRVRFNLSDVFKHNDQRESYRVSVAASEIYAFINGDENCKVLDVSANGMAIISHKPFKRGLVLDLDLEFEGKRYSGRTIIRNVASIDAHLSRFGLEALEGEKKLTQGLQQVCIKVQREQIRRMRDKGIAA